MISTKQLFFRGFCLEHVLLANEQIELVLKLNLGLKKIPTNMASGKWGNWSQTRNQTRSASTQLSTSSFSSKLK